MEIENIGVVGAGIMGSGIAQVLADGGFSVIMIDRSIDVVKRARGKIERSLEDLVKKGHITEDRYHDICIRIGVGAQLSDLSDVDFVIEAASENQATKIDILRQIDAIVRPSAVVATNTSSISVTRLGASTTHSDRVIGMHFFNPVPRMGLVELIRAMTTSDATHSIAESLVRKIGKTPITVANSPGFAVNRILCPMLTRRSLRFRRGLHLPKRLMME
jgi:3-hydroxybutyryl-CoA dehydrogenase